MAGGKEDLQHFPLHYVPYSEIAAEAGRRAQALEALRRYNPERAGEIDDFLRRHGVQEGEVGFLALRARLGERAVIVRPNGEILAMLNLAPWGI